MSFSRIPESQLQPKSLSWLSEILKQKLGSRFGSHDRNIMTNTEIIVKIRTLTKPSKKMPELIIVTRQPISSQLKGAGEA